MNIQGNILSPFAKDHQLLLAFGFGADASATRAWLGRMADVTASDDEVARFNDLFKSMNTRRHGERGVLKATWVELLLTAPGLEALGIAQAEVETVSPAFAEGMAARADILGDRQESDPSTWVSPFGRGVIHAMVIIAADDREDLCREADRIEQQALDHGMSLLWRKHGNTLPQPLTGHEHFGFKDGISQPNVAGPDAVPLSEFLLGQTTAGQADPWGGSTPTLPAWAQDASLVVFRLLHQDVAGFRAFLEQNSGALGATPQQLAAKLVGRWPSGAPLAKAPDADDPSIAEDPAQNNAFDYSDDPDGHSTPHFAHIRKVFPRKEQPNPPAGDSDERRILRRGIPYGPPLPAEGATQEGITADRGLLFFCVQASLEQQFEFIQQNWCNSPDFPTGPKPPVQEYQASPGEPGDGPDPIIGQHHGQGQDNLKTPQGDHRFMLQQFVTVRGGEYLIALSIDALKTLAST